MKLEEPDELLRFRKDLDAVPARPQTGSNLTQNTGPPSNQLYFLQKLSLNLTQVVELAGLLHIRLRHIHPRNNGNQLVLIGFRNLPIPLRLSMAVLNVEN